MSNAPVARVYHVPSDSDPSKRWEVLERTDGELSCACPVWVFNKRKTTPRSCKHTEQVKAGYITPTTTYVNNIIAKNRESNPFSEYESPREQRIMGRRERERRIRNEELNSLVKETKEILQGKVATAAKPVEKKPELEEAVPQRRINWRRS